mmetsp:Transcript_5888/g.13421  ORF Transcript_5888/g.13421 Transcript_5888/m.13421 type:complete len:206 (-) Transcript_5888:96-713(-)
MCFFWHSSIKIIFFAVSCTHRNHPLFSSSLHIGHNVSLSLSDPSFRGHGGPHHVQPKQGRGSGGWTKSLRFFMTPKSFLAITGSNTTEYRLVLFRLLAGGFWQETASFTRTLDSVWGLLKYVHLLICILNPPTAALSLRKWMTLEHLGHCRDTDLGGASSLRTFAGLPLLFWSSFDFVLFVGETLHNELVAGGSLRSLSAIPARS